jgi:hypothetical protein
MNALWEADVFILLYTDPQKDWSYCSWEYGVALDDRKPDARPILLQFCDKFPALFADQVRVDAQKRDDVQKFTKELLTDQDFFPNHPGPATDFLPEGDDVRTLGGELFDLLRDVAPQLGDESEWPGYPSLQLAISLDHIERIHQCPSTDRLGVTKDVVESAAEVTYGDVHAGRLFGKAGKIPNVAFKELLDGWKECYPDSEARWVDALCSQLMSAAKDNLPRLNWELMRSMDQDDHTWYGPALIMVHKTPRERCMKFDVCFLKFCLDDDGRVVAGVPKA